MKKVVLLNLIIEASAWGMLVSTNNGTIDTCNKVSTTRSSVLSQNASNDNSNGSGVIGTGSEDSFKRVITSREITNPHVFREKVLVEINEIAGDEQVGSFEKEFPLYRKTTGYTKDLTKGVSYPIQDLYTEITGVEHSDITGEYIFSRDEVNTKVSYPHHKRTTGYRYDDNNLKAYPLSQIYIHADGKDHVISEAQERTGDAPVDYERTREPAKASLLNLANQGSRVQAAEISEEYSGPNNHKFVRKTRREFPIEYSFLRFENETNASYPRNERYIFVNGKKLHMDYVTDRSTRYPHQKRTTGYENDDENLRSNPYTEIYFTANGEKHVVDSAKHRNDDAFVPYEEVEKGPIQRLDIARSDDDNDYYNTRQETKYRRADGSIYTKVTPGTDTVLKEKQPDSMPPAQETVVNQQAPADDPRTLEDVAYNIVTLGGGCEVM